MDRDVNKPLRDDYAVKPPATDQDRKAKKPTSQDKSEDEETEKKARQTGLAHFEHVHTSVKAVMSDVPSLELAEGLSGPERKAIELLYQAQTGTNARGTYAAGAECKQYLNKALATLQPVLSMALNPSLGQLLQDSYQEMQGQIGVLKHDITNRIFKEAHLGRMIIDPSQQAADAGEGEGEPTKSPLGSIAWELAQLVKKRKRSKLPYDPTSNPVVEVLDAMQSDALELGKLAAEIAKLDERRAKQKDPAAQKTAERACQDACAKLGVKLREFLESCQPDHPEPKAAGHYPVLAERFAGHVARIGDLDRVEVLLGVAADTATEIYACVDDAAAIVEAAGGAAKKRGVLGSLFGRKKS